MATKTAALLSFLALVVASALTIGCGSRSGAPLGEGVVVWHWMTDREEAFFALAERYKEETGVQVSFQLYAPSHAYEQKVRLGAQTQTLPEVFGVPGDVRDMARFIQAGHLVNLQEALGTGEGSWKERFFDEALMNTYFSEGNRFDVPPGYYGIPFDISTIPMILNRTLFEGAGLDPDSPPATWAEFLDAGRALRASGVNGFVAGWGEVWLIYSLATSLAHNLMGEAKVMDTFRGRVPYTDPDWIRVLDAFADIQRAGFADPSLVTLRNKNAEQAFAAGRAGMTFNGSWAVNVFAQMNPNLDYAPFRVPALDPKGPQPVWGGPGSVFSVNAQSEKKEEAIQFLTWFTAPAQAAYLSQETKNLPATRGVETSETPVLARFADLMEGSIHPNRFALTEDPRVIEVINKGIQSILIASKTPREIAEEIQRMKDRVSTETP